jgi:hypothetical protein
MNAPAETDGPTVWSAKWRPSEGDYAITCDVDIAPHIGVRPRIHSLRDEVERAAAMALGRLLAERIVSALNDGPSTVKHAVAVCRAHGLEPRPAEEVRASDDLGARVGALEAQMAQGQEAVLDIATTLASIPARVAATCAEVDALNIFRGAHESLIATHERRLDALESRPLVPAYPGQPTQPPTRKLESAPLEIDPPATIGDGFAALAEMQRERDELGRRCGISPDSGTFSTYLGNLTTNGLAEKRGRELFAGSSLFLGGRHA